MPKRRQIIEIFAPVLGVKSDAPANLLDPRSQPRIQNANLYYGVNQKEYGTSLYATASGSALGAPINHIFEAQFPNSNVLEIFTATGVYKYSAGADAFVSDGQVFSGTFNDYWSSVMYNDVMIYNNGINDIQYKASVAATGTTMQSAVSPSTYKAWALAGLREHLCLYHLVENGSEHYKRVRWSKKGTLSYSAGTTDFESGTAGAVDVSDIEGEIKTAQPLGAGIAIYADRSVHVQFWVGGDEVFRFQKMVSGIGTPSRRGVVGWEDVNYIFAHKNVYAYHGGDDFRPIGNPIKQKMYSEINNSAYANVWLEFDPQDRKLLVHAPTGSSEFPNKTYVYRVDEESWSELDRSYTSVGRTTRKTGLTIGELIGSIGAQSFTYGDAQIRVDAEVKIYGDQSGRVVKEDKTIFTISNSGTDTAQVFTYETPDLTGANAVDPVSRDKVDFTAVDKRFTEYNVNLEGNGSASISISTDKGSTFVELPESPVTLVPAGTTHTVGLSERGEQIRFRIVNTGTNEFIGVGYQKVEFVPGSENR